MGKNIIQQARGHGGPRYKAPSFRYAGEARLPRQNPELQEGKIVDLINCPGHYAPLAKLLFKNGTSCLHIAPEGVRVGGMIAVGTNADASKPGNVLPLSEIPEGALIYNIELRPGDGGKICRVAGMSARLLTKTDGAIIIRLPSKHERAFHPQCRAAMGIIAGSGRLEKPLLKAGAAHFARKARNKLYPITSGCAQNAVDHPFGNKRSARKAKQKAVSQFAPPGRKVGTLRPRRTGRRKK